MLSRLLVSAFIAMSASVASAVPVLDAGDAGDALDARMAKLEATVGNLKEQDVNEEWSSSKPMTHDWGWGSKSKFGKKKTLGPKVPKKTTCEKVAECTAETLKEQDVNEEWATGWLKKPKKTLGSKAGSGKFKTYCERVAECKAETLKEQDVKEEWGTWNMKGKTKKTPAVPFCDQVAAC